MNETLLVIFALFMAAAMVTMPFWIRLWVDYLLWGIDVPLGTICRWYWRAYDAIALRRYRGNKND